MTATADFPNIPDFLDRRNDAAAAQATCGITTTPSVIEFHPLAAMFPLMEGQEFDLFVNDIRENGLRVPVVMHEDKILEGRNRYRACVMADVDCRFEAYAGDDPAAYVISMNLHRRHLSPERRRDLIAKLLKATPDKSDRQIAELAKASPTTVGAVRATVQVGQLPEKRIGKDGKSRKQPATKKRRTEDDFRRDLAKKKAPVPKPPPDKTTPEVIAIDEELELLREFARWFVSERARVACDPKDRDEWRMLFDRVKAVLA